MSVIWRVLSEDYCLRTGSMEKSIPRASKAKPFPQPLFCTLPSVYFFSSGAVLLLHHQERNYHSVTFLWLWTDSTDCWWWLPPKALGMHVILHALWGSFWTMQSWSLSLCQLSREPCAGVTVPTSFCVLEILAPALLVCHEKVPK